jgi:ribonuclease T1
MAGRRLRERVAAWALVLAALMAGLVTGCGGASDSATVPGRTQTQVSSSAAYTGVDAESGLAWIARDELPPEALDTLAVIAAGPPYEYARDGITFENREGLLPEHEYGYYEEFTVETPGSSDRGARRIVWGLQDELYYTADHYQSFERIAS